MTWTLDMEVRNRPGDQTLKATGKEASLLGQETVPGCTDRQLCLRANLTLQINRSDDGCEKR